MVIRVALTMGLKWKSHTLHSWQGKSLKYELLHLAKVFTFAWKTLLHSPASLHKSSDRIFIHLITHQPPTSSIVLCSLPPEGFLYSLWKKPSWNPAKTDVACSHWVSSTFFKLQKFYLLHYRIFPSVYIKENFLLVFRYEHFTFQEYSWLPR